VKENIDKVVEGSLKVRKETLERLFRLLSKSGRALIFISFASIIAIIAFLIGSKIKEKEDDKILRHFHI
jgi:hypothetical protein